MDAHAREQRLQTIFLFILSSACIAVGLYALRPVMIPFVLALFFSLLLSPCIDLQVRYLRIPYKLATLTTIVFGFALLVLFGILVTASVNQLASNASFYQERIERLLRMIVANVDGKLFFGLEPKEFVMPLIQNIGNNVGSWIFVGINSIIKVLSKGVLVCIFVLFLLIGKAKGPRRHHRVFKESQLRIRHYIVAKVIISAFTGVLVWATLAILNIKLALVFGLAAFILNFIPSIGSIISTLLPIPIVFFDPEISLLVASLAIGIPGLVQFTIGNVVEPSVVGDALDLHPVVILMALIFWGMIWGVVGMLLAVPLTSIMKILFENMELTAPLSQLLSGRLPEEKEAEPAAS